MQHSRIERRLLALFAFAFICTFLVVLRTSLQQAPEAVETDPEEVKKLVTELDRLEQVLREERKQLDELNRKLLISHPRAQIGKYNPKLNDFEKPPKPVWSQPIPVLVFVCNRPSAVREHLRKLFRTSREQFPIVVSQDCDHRELQTTIKSEFGADVEYIKHISSETARLKVPPEHRKFAVYYKIARHYKLALDHVFHKLNHSTVIITEDDLDIALDFFEYFLATRPLLEADNSLFCVSAWNDNGKPGLIDTNANSLLYRTDFFPGLGWMMTRNLWLELGPKWPAGFWDDFMREPEQRRNRSCIRPEISRTAMTDFGRSGASKGLFFNRHLKRILLNQQPVQFTQLGLHYLQRDQYEPGFVRRVYNLPTITQEQLLLLKEGNGSEHRIEYDTMEHFVQIAQRIGIMADTKAGVPRTAYFGIVSCFFNGNRLFIAPANPAKWAGYDRRWEAPREILDGLQ